VRVLRRRWGDQVDAFGQAQQWSTARAYSSRGEVEPGPAGVDRQTRPRFDLATAQGIAISSGWLGLAVSSRIIGSIAGGDTKRLKKALLLLPAASLIMVVATLAVKAL